MEPINKAVVEKDSSVTFDNIFTYVPLFGKILEKSIAGLGNIK